MEHNEPNDQGAIRLDDPTLNHRAGHLPDNVREAFVWLGIYLREQCGRDVDILADRFTRVGVDHDKTTWSKILRGHWFTHPNDEPRATPVLSVAKFLKAVNALRDDARRRAMAGRIPFVMTPTAQRIFDYIELLLAPDWVNKFGVIIGETGTQKTATCKHYCELHNHGRCVWMEAPATGSLTQFITDWAARYGASPQISTHRKLIHIQQSLRLMTDDGKAGVTYGQASSRLVVIENVQRLYDPRRNADQPVFHLLQKIQEETGLAVLLTFTPVFYETFTKGSAQGFFEQFIGRSGGTDSFLRLDPFPPAEDVVQIAESFGLDDAARHTDALVKIARRPGRIRILFDVLQRARVLAGKRGLTFADIQRIEERRAA